MIELPLDFIDVLVSQVDNEGDLINTYVIKVAGMNFGLCNVYNPRGYSLIYMIDISSIRLLDSELEISGRINDIWLGGIPIRGCYGKLCCSYTYELITEVITIPLNWFSGTLINSKDPYDQFIVQLFNALYALNNIGEASNELVHIDALESIRSRLNDLCKDTLIYIEALIKDQSITLIGSDYD